MFAPTTNFLIADLVSFLNGTIFSMNSIKITSYNRMLIAYYTLLVRKQKVLIVDGLYLGQL